MPICTQWFNAEQDIILIVVQGAWTWEEMKQAIATIHKMMDRVDYCVSTLFDGTCANGWPPNSLAGLQSVTQYMHPNSYSVAVVGINIFLRSMLDLYERVRGSYRNPNGVYFIDTVEEAAKLLRQKLDATKIKGA